MLGDIPVEDPARAALEDDEDVEDRKRKVTVMKKPQATTAFA
jgi:hypothetical protein